MQIKKQDKTWISFLEERYEEIVNFKPVSFHTLIPSMIPQAKGVYLITACKSQYELPYYVGRTVNLRRRIYTNHLMGPIANARLKRYLLGSGECKNITDAKEFIRKNCNVRWIEENDTRIRGAIEGYITGLLFPAYGIYQEH